MIPGLFLQDGRVIGLSRHFRPPRIPLAISVEKMVLEITGLESGSGLIMGDLIAGVSGHEGRRVWQAGLNVRVSAFHEWRGAGEKATPGGHDLVNRKKIVTEIDQGLLYSILSWSRDHRVFFPGLEARSTFLKIGSSG